MAYYRVDPPACRSARRVEAGGAVPQIEEGVMQDVLGQCAITHDAQGHPQQIAALVFVKRLQCTALAARAGQQGGFMIEGGGDVSHAKSGSGRRLPGRNVRPG